jgi:hypothetical protein
MPNCSNRVEYIYEDRWKTGVFQALALFTPAKWTKDQLFWQDFIYRRTDLKSDIVDINANIEQ